MTSLDESGRRYRRDNPSAGGQPATTVGWAFDRKHRPVITKFDPVGGTPSTEIAAYDYLGGGFMHRRHRYTHPMDNSRVVSEFHRDELLRVTDVVHAKDLDNNGLEQGADPLLAR